MKFLVLVACAVTIANAQWGYQHVPRLTNQGVPEDTPEVQAAKQQHFAALAAAGNGISLNQGYLGPQVFPGVTNQGVPIDTPEVQAAKARHFAALSAAGGGFAYSNVLDYGSGYQGRYSGPQHVPVLTNQGVPVDTPEVQAARAKHLSALAAAGAVAGGYDGGYYPGNDGGVYGGAYQPVITNNGVPQDTPEVQAAKERHFAAVRKAASQSYAYY